MLHRHGFFLTGRWTTLVGLAAGGLALLACDGDGVDPGDGGAVAMDAGSGDAGSADAGSGDAGSGAEDAGSGAEDAGSGGEDAGPGDEDGGAGDEDAGPPCDDMDRDGVCDGEDPTCNGDGSRLTCRQLAPECPEGGVPEVRNGCYTDRCVTWAECAELVGEPECAADADCPDAYACRLGACRPADCEVALTVPGDDRYHDRFEGSGFDNACATDADCFVGGCSGEVCAAEIGASTCEELPYLPSGDCGCVDGQCSWHTDECAAPLGCRLDEDCADGEICLDGACVEARCEHTPTVSSAERYYERFEGVGLDNACSADADCVVGGCSGEVCSAERASTTCEALPYGPSGSCGCVAGQCIWNRSSCDDPPARLCGAVADGEFGACREIMGWGVSAETGACIVISGCGCTDEPSCGGRIFESEEECQASCELELCFRDDQPISCRAPTPSCREGRIPEVRDGCYTGECVRPEGCLPVPAPSCAGDTDCERGEICRDGRCAEAPAECRDEADCRDGEICRDGRCVEAPAECRGDADCRDGEICRDGRCVAVAPGCRADADCRDGEVCRDGLCEAAECVAVPTVPPDDRYYDRFEGVAVDNTCRDASDCVRGGCSGEVCAAERAASTCELLPYGPEGSCGCVDGQCIWHRLDCGGAEPAECDPVRPGELGLCDRILGWAVSAVSGRCETISGCGCGDDACDGRVFSTEAECQRACVSAECAADADRDGVCDSGDAECNSDGSELTCRQAAPACPDDTVPEVSGGCYTDRCASWAECARLVEAARGA